MKHRLKVFVFTAVIISLSNGYAGNSAYYSPPRSVVLVRKIDIPVDESSIAVSVAYGSSQTLYLITNYPPKLWQIRLDESKFNSLDLTEYRIFDPQDITVISGLNIQLVDLTFSKVFNFNRRMDFLPAINLDFEDQRFEPVSISGTTDGILFVLNRIDGDIWRVERNGNAFPFDASITGKGWLRKPEIIRVSQKNNQLLIIDDGELKAGDYYGNQRAKTKIGKAHAFTSGDREIWILGERLSCLSTDDYKPVFTISREEINSWGLKSPISIDMGDDDTLFIVSMQGSFIVELKILRDGN